MHAGCQKAAEEEDSNESCNAGLSLGLLLSTVGKAPTSVDVDVDVCSVRPFKGLFAKFGFKKEKHGVIM